MPKFTTTYNFVFAGGVCMLLSLGVAAAAQGLKPMQEANRKRDVQMNILSALGLPEDGSTLKGSAIEEMYEARVRQVILDTKGQPVEGKTTEDWKAAWAAVYNTDKKPELLPVFERIDDGQPVRYALYQQGNGLWGPLSGYVAIDTKGTEYLGVTFFAPKETPGLGAEVQESWFEDQFKGKKLDPAHPVDVVKGKAADLCTGDQLAYCVDGVSGSTLTSNGLDAMIASGLDIYAPFINNLRKP
ncbi:MAG: FMN-binding protein [Deltaproteobacteria bacterium]|nr:FMN-binding protein [Deltaproteobacteria bacterium]